MKLELSRWNPSTILENRMILVHGRRGTGKSTLLESIMYDLQDRFDIVIGFCPTSTTRKMLLQHIPEACVFDNHDDGIIEIVMNELGNLLGGPKARKGLIVEDDVAFEKNIFSTKVMSRLALNGRHQGVTYMNCIQYSVCIPPQIRSQFDITITLRENIRANRVRLHEFFFGVFDTLEEFSAVLSAVTEDYGALVLDNTATANDISKVVFWYKSHYPIPPFTMGRKCFFTLTEMYRRKHKLESAKDDNVEAKRPKVEVEMK